MVLFVVFQLLHYFDGVVVPFMSALLAANAGALTNFEVLDFLRSRGAGRDPTRVIFPIAPSEFKVYDYLEQTAACNQTRQVIGEFLEKCKSVNLAKAEILNIINIRPSSLVELYPIIEEYDTRFGEAAETMEEFVETVVKLLPPPPNQMQSEEETATDQKEAADGERMETAE
ncbi:putative phosphoglucan phosphatase DSP4, chloroplastic-like isoform X1 [Capsicum annuum]|nr:putative phosphoglucan phosphatase DSP4, chloroplastic-like isoform X1 [Capsicum annuum]